MSPPSRQLAATHVADLIAEQKRLIGMMIFALGIVQEDRFVGVPYPASQSAIGLRRKGGQLRQQDNLFASLDEVRADPDYFRSSMRTLLTAVVAVVGDALAQNAYFDKSPILEFHRHVRNGTSHGNRFYFNAREPSRPAVWDNMQITKQLAGHEVLFGYIEAGDVIALLNDVATHLRQLP